MGSTLTYRSTEMAPVYTGWSTVHLERYHNAGDLFLQLIVDIDETWASVYEPELKCQSSEWRLRGSPHPQKARQEPSRVEIMMIVAYDHEGVILSHAVPAGHAEYYFRFVKYHLRPAVRRKSLCFLQDIHPIIIYDNISFNLVDDVT